MSPYDEYERDWEDADKVVEEAEPEDEDAIDVFKDVKEPDNLHLADLKLTTQTRNQFGDAKETKLVAQCYRAAVARDNTIMLLDVVGNTQVIRAISAGLHKSVTVSFGLEGCYEIGRHWTLKKDTEHGYRTETESIGPPGCALTHFIAISNAPGFMPYVNPTALAKCLARDDYQTPFLSPVLHGPEVPDWLPWIAKRLIDERTLSYIYSHNCKAGIIKPDAGQIEQIISEGVRDGHLKWVDYDVNEIIKANTELARRK